MKYLRIIPYVLLMKVKFGSKELLKNRLKTVCAIQQHHFAAELDKLRKVENVTGQSSSFFHHLCLYL